MPIHVERAIAVIALIGACLFLFVFGFLGIGREGNYGFDFHVFHGAGAMFWEGVNFWRVTADAESPYSYPPHATLLIALYALLPIKFALLVHTVLNLASLATIVFLAHRWFLKLSRFQDLTLAQGLGIAIVIGNPFVAHVFFMGQLSILAVASVLLSWHMLNTQRWLLSAAFLAIATIKPQVSLIYVIWLIINQQFRVVFTGGVVAVLMMLPALVAFGPIGTFESWLASMVGYSSNMANNLGAAHVFGVESILVKIGVPGAIAKTFSIAMASVCLVVLFGRRNFLDPAVIIHFLFAISLLFIYAHDYDLASLGVMYSFLIILALKKRGIVPFVIAMLVLLLLFFPQRFVRELDFPLLLHWRVLLLPICCYLILNFEQRHRARHFNEPVQNYQLRGLT